MIHAAHIRIAVLAHWWVVLHRAICSKEKEIEALREPSWVLAGNHRWKPRLVCVGCMTQKDLDSGNYDDIPESDRLRVLARLAAEQEMEVLRDQWDTLTKRIGFGRRGRAFWRILREVGDEMVGAAMVAEALRNEAKMTRKDRHGQDPDSYRRAKNVLGDHGETA